MHELSISQAIVDVVLEHAQGRPVEAVAVRIGALRRVRPESLTSCWDVVRRRPPLERSVLLVEEVPGVVHCTSCGRRSTLGGSRLRCPACGDGQVRVLRGEECQVTAVELVAGRTV